MEDNTVSMSRTKDQGRNWATEYAKREARRRGIGVCELLLVMLKVAKAAKDSKKIGEITEALKYLKCKGSGIGRRAK